MNSALKAVAALILSAAVGSATAAMAQDEAAWSVCQGKTGPASLDQLINQCSAAEDCTAAPPALSLDQLMRGCTTIIESGSEPSIRRVLAAYQRGRARTLKGDLSDAIIDFDFALSLDRAFAEAVERRGEVYAALGEQQQAISDLTEAIRLKPGLARAYSRRAVVYFKEHDAGRAIADLTTALAIDPRSAADLNNRCWMRAASGSDLPGALADCNLAVELRPDAPAALNSRGFVHLRMKDYAAALADYRAALAKNPRDPGLRSSSLYGQGLARRAMGEAAGGRADIDAALTLDPTAGRDYAAAGLLP